MGCRIPASISFYWSRRFVLSGREVQLVEEMIGALVAAGGLGLLLGLRYRVPALLFASIAVAVAAAVVAVLAGASALAALGLSLGAVATLQCGYLGGLLVAYAASRAKPRRSGGPML
jgi:hypothetical protein